MIKDWSAVAQALAGRENASMLRHWLTD